MRAFLMCTCARNAAHYYLGFVLGCAAAGGLDAGAIAGGAVFWMALSTLVEGANRLSDRLEDEVNRPERTYLCHRVGFDRLRRITQWCGVSVSVYAAIWMFQHRSLWLVVFLSLAIVIALGYSYLPGSLTSLKRSRRLSPLLLTTPTIGPFLVGWFSAGEHAVPSLVGAPFAFLVVAFLILLVAGGAKDVTDLDGDALVGYRSMWVDVSRRPGALVATSTVPAAGVVVLSLAGPLPSRAAAAAPVIFASLRLLGQRGRVAIRHAGAGGVLVRTMSSHLQLLLVALVGVLSFGSVGLLAVVAGTTVFWFAADRWLYWSRFRLPAGVAISGGTGR